MSDLFRRILYTLVSLCAIGILVFLFVKSQEFSIEHQQSVAEKLRDLRQLDADMDAGVLRTNVGLVGDYDPLAAAVTSMLATTGVLESEYQWQGADPSLLQRIKQQVEEKTGLVDRFKAENAVLRNSLRYLPTIRDEVITIFGNYHDKKGLGKDLEARVDGIFQSTLRYSLFSDLGVQQSAEKGAGSSGGAIEAALNELDEIVNVALQGIATEVASGKEEAVTLANNLDQVRTFVSHSRAVLRQGALVTQRMEEIFAIPLVQSIGVMSDAVQESTLANLADAERYQIYLLAYAAVLLLVIFYFAIRLALSYRLISSANKQLQVANETLEERVEERTVDLERALQDLKLSESHLVQSEKMASLGQMVAGVAHEINTPLAYVRSALETIESNVMTSPLRGFVAASERLVGAMQQGEASNEELSSRFSEASGALDSLGGEGLVLFDEMGALINDGIYGADQIKELVLNLRNFSRLDKEKVAVFQVEEGIESSLMLAKSVVKNRQILKNYGGVPPVSCSPSQINQVFLNIITNAVHATQEESGTISIDTFQDSPGFVQIRISDNGTGIDSEHLTKVFDPFFTTKDVGKGTGLGLSIVYKIVREHGGDITVDSVLGQGTSFLISLPIKQGATAA
ncbi:MAG: DAHL domain-containing protein [Azovibrio sp.]